MTKTNRIKELEEQIKFYQDAYYDGEGLISDYEFDKLWDELTSLDPANPILHKVGADSGNFEKATHVMPMGSQAKAMTEEEFTAWAKKHAYNEYLVEYKLDGASLELQYVEGKLVRAVTRGNGEIGDVITDNAIKMQGVIPLIHSSFTGGIRGEVIMTHSVHDKLYADKANCRNAANGLMKRVDGEGSENLTLIVYDAWSTDDDKYFADEVAKLDFLESYGFNVVNLKICHSINEVIDYRNSMTESRQHLDYDIDGLVIKERTINHEDASRDRPDRQIAFKFNLDEAVSILRDVEWNESGATYTPIAVFDPVELNGTTVRRASLANPNLVRNLGLKIGSHVVVVKRGEIIPKIINVVPTNDKCSAIKFPKVCSICGSTLVDEGTRLYCPNSKCEKKILHKIEKWTNVIDIKDLGVTLMESLYKTKRVKAISDLYTLTVEELSSYFLDDKSLAKGKESLGAEKVYKSIQSRTKINLAKFIGGLDIENVGETLIESLINNGINTLDKLMSASVEDIASIKGFAKKTAKAIVDGLKDNEEEIKKLSKILTIVEGEENKEGSLTGLSFCFTGELNTMKRPQAQTMVKDNGGEVKNSVAKGLTYLVTNNPNSGSAKNKKAKEFGIKIITESEFLSLVN